jgi:hypothetical protein
MIAQRRGMPNAGKFTNRPCQKVSTLFIDSRATLTSTGAE